MPVTNPPSFGSVRTEFAALGTANNLFAYRRGGGIVPNTSAYNAIGTGGAGSEVRLSQFAGIAAISFTPASGTPLTGTGIDSSQVSVFASSPVTFTYNTTSSFGGSVGAFINSTEISIILNSFTYWNDLDNSGTQDVGEIGAFAAGATGTITATVGGSTVGTWNWTLSNDGFGPGPPP